MKKICNFYDNIISNNIVYQSDGETINGVFGEVEPGLLNVYDMPMIKQVTSHKCTYIVYYETTHEYLLKGEECDIFIDTKSGYTEIFTKQNLDYIDNL